MSTSRRKARLAGLVIAATGVVAVAIAVAGLHILRGALVSTESIDGGALVSSDGRTVSVMGVAPACSATTTRQSPMVLRRAARSCTRGTAGPACW